MMHRRFTNNFPITRSIIFCLVKNLCRIIPTNLSSSSSCLIILSIASLSSKLPCQLQSCRAFEAGYAYLLMASATIFDLPGTYFTSRSNLLRVSCHLARLPAGPEGVSTCSETQCSRAWTFASTAWLTESGHLGMGTTF